MKIHHRLLLCGTAAMALVAAPGEAKCPPHSYRLEIEVRSSLTGRPLPDVQLTVFANGSEVELPTGPALSRATTGTDGRLARTYLFNTYSGQGVLRAERCDEKIRTLEVVMVHPAHRARRTVLHRVAARSDSNSDIKTVVVPPTQMDPLQP